MISGLVSLTGTLSVKILGCLLGNIAFLPRQSIMAVGWLEQRVDSVYLKDPTYKASAAVPFALEPSPPEDLPDALKGEQWSFVQLPLGVLREELEAVRQVQVML